MSITVQVYRGGRLLKTIDRPAHQGEDGVLVRYKGRLHPVRGGAIHVDAANKEPSAARQPKPAGGPDDMAVRTRIITANAGERMLVEAGPGTGKTETAARRLAELIRAGVRPSRILVLSFEPCAFLTLRRVGRQAASLLARPHDGNISQLTELLSGPEQKEILDQIGQKAHVLVDEYQDLPGPRGELLLALLPLVAPPDSRGCGFTILGDPAQAIYGFAGEPVGNSTGSDLAAWRSRLLALYGQGLERLELTKNHRSQGVMLKLANNLRSIVLSGLADEVRLAQIRSAVAGLPTCETSLETELPRCDGSTAILARTNGQCLAIARRMWKRDDTSPMLRTRGSITWPPAWVGALLRRLKAGELLRQQFGRIHATYGGGPGIPSLAESWRQLAEIAGVPADSTSIPMETLRQRMCWPDAFADELSVQHGEILVTTIHQSKGMEFDRVLLLDRPEDEAPSDPGEEARVAYVAATRARRVLERLPGDAIHMPPTFREMSDGRERLVAWRNGWMNVEMGLTGDIDDDGFVDPELLGGAEGREDVQELLRTQAMALPGRRVMLVRRGSASDTTWGIHLQEGNAPGLLIGRTAKIVAYDLLRLLYKPGYSLPQKIFNLRIAQVRTCFARGSMPPLEPERTSGLWLGVALCGTGDFKTRKRT